MTKEEAIELMKKGVKMTHDFFTPTEWVSIGKNGKYVFEDGVECNHDEFWQYRQNEYWKDGWIVFKD